MRHVPAVVLSGLCFAACTSLPPQPPQPAPATDAARRSSEPQQDTRRGRPVIEPRQIFIGVGFTDGPDTFLLGGEADFPMNPRLSIGPMLQLGLDDHTTFVAPSFQAKYRIPLEYGGGPSAFTPFVQGGIGAAYLDKNQPSDNHSGAGLLLHIGGGVEMQLDKDLVLATNLQADLLPDHVAGEGFMWSWQILQLGFRF
jgi:hypothetical protein